MSRSSYRNCVALVLKNKVTLQAGGYYNTHFRMLTIVMLTIVNINSKKKSVSNAQFTFPQAINAGKANLICTVQGIVIQV